MRKAGIAKTAVGAVPRVAVHRAFRELTRIGRSAMITQRVQDFAAPSLLAGEVRRERRGERVARRRPIAVDAQEMEPRDAPRFVAPGASEVVQPAQEGGR